MEILFPVLGIVGVLAVGVVSPGPSFIFIAQRSMSLTRTDGIFASLGMGIGGVFFAVLSLVGLHLLMSAFPALYSLLRIAGGVYLMVVAYRIWKGAKSNLSVGSLEQTESPQRARSFFLGLLTQVSNPKTIVVYSTVFAGFLPPQFDGRFVAVLLPAVFAVETAWYCFVALVLSSSRPRQVYGKFKKAIDRTASALLGALGVKLAAEGVLEASRP